MTAPTPTLFTGISELALPHGQQSPGDRVPVDVIRDGALVVAPDGHVLAAGPVKEVLADFPGAPAIDLGGRAVVPGLVDSHTHIVFSGSRVDEMGRRARGETYEEIAAAGGGIVSTQNALSEATVDEIVSQSLLRLRHVIERGTTLIEVKTGYGLTPELEAKHLEAIEGLASKSPIPIRITLLAHVIPPEHRGDRPGFIKRLVDEFILPNAPRAHYCDIFVEEGAFSVDEARSIGAAAKQSGLGLKLHIDQLRDGGGAALAAELEALSADHLEYANPDARSSLAQAGVVATVLPACALFLGKGPFPDARGLRDAGCQVAVATDFNPGSAMVGDLAFCGAIAATRCGLSLEEALWGVTRGGAMALGLGDQGTLRPGSRGDFLVLDGRDWRELFYQLGAPPVADRYLGGRRLALSP